MSDTRVEASTNWGHSYPTVFAAIVEDVCAGHLLGRDPLAIRDRVAELGVVLDGYLGPEGATSQTIGAIEIALWDIVGKHLGAPVHRLLGGAAYPIPLYPMAYRSTVTPWTTAAEPGCSFTPSL